MRAKQVSLSVAAGLATPGAVFLLNAGFGGFRFGFIEPRFAAMYVAVGFLVALAVALWRPILPVVYPSPADFFNGCAQVWSQPDLLD